MLRAVVVSRFKEGNTPEMDMLRRILEKKREVGYLETGKIIIRALYFEIINFPRAHYYKLINFLGVQYFEFLNGLMAPLRKDDRKEPWHQVYKDFIARVNQLTDYRILELGSRNVGGLSKRDAFRGYRDYVGFDIHHGEDVDVVGDIHQLSSYFPTESFDAVFSVAVFEHLAMPWKAILEINKVLKKDGLLFIWAPTTWPPHDLPWDFWRYSKEAFKALLNPYTGFTILSCLEGSPCRIFSLSPSATTRGIHRSPAYLSVAVLAMKTSSPDSRLSWEITTEEIMRTMYPKSQ